MKQGLDAMDVRPIEDYIADVDLWIAQKHELHLRDEEQGLYNRIQDRVAELAGPQYRAASETLDRLYESVQVFDLDKTTGEKVYRTFSDGRFIYDWSKLSKARLEEAVMELLQAYWVIQDESSRLQAQVILARNIHDAHHWDWYGKAVSGTREQMHAYARRNTKEVRAAYVYIEAVAMTVQKRAETIEKTMKYLQMRLASLSRPGFVYD